MTRSGWHTAYLWEPSLLAKNHDAVALKNPIPVGAELARDKDTLLRQIHRIAQFAGKPRSNGVLDLL